KEDECRGGQSHCRIGHRMDDFVGFQQQNTKKAHNTNTIQNKNKRQLRYARHNEQNAAGPLLKATINVISQDDVGPQDEHHQHQNIDEHGF
ncbi:hypothetical protein D018_0506B, partial [Vibrio parahaemolyticus VP2007-007]